MKIKIKLWLMREIERRNDERIVAYTKTRKPPSQPRKRKPMRNKGKHKKRLE